MARTPGPSVVETRLDYSREKMPWPRRRFSYSLPAILREAQPMLGWPGGHRSSGDAAIRVKATYGLARAEMTGVIDGLTIVLVDWGQTREPSEDSGQFGGVGEESAGYLRPCAQNRCAASERRLGRGRERSG
jgi:hypothetical protein